MTKARLFLLSSILSPNLAVWWSGQNEGRFVFSLFWTFSLSLLVCTLPRRVLIGIAFGVLLLLPLTLYWIGFGGIMGYAPNLHALDTVFHTDLNESYEALVLVLRYPAGIAGAVFHLVFLGLAFRALFRAEDRDLPKFLRSVTALLCLLPLCVALTLQNFGWRAVSPISEADALESFPLSLGLIASELLEVASGEYNLSITNDVERFPAPKTQDVVTSPLLSLMVIGESTRRDYLGPDVAAQGIYLQQLSNRLRAGGGVWLPPTCASSNGTAASVPMLMTGTAPGDFGPATSKAPSGLAYLKASGFSTAWISNQTRNVFLEGGWDFSSWTQIASRRAPDEEILPVVAHFASDYFGSSSPRKPKALVLHFLGAHFDYGDRYPKNLFPPEPAGLSEENLETLRYGRAVEYQAKVLLDLAQMLDRIQWPAYFVYTSDHGENLLADRNGLHFHQAKRTSLRDAWVPALVVWNRAFQDSARPGELLDHLVRAKTLAHRDIYRAWLALAGLSVTMPLMPTANPTILANDQEGGRHRAVECTLLMP